GGGGAGGGGRGGGKGGHPGAGGYRRPQHGEPADGCTRSVDLQERGRDLGGGAEALDRALFGVFRRRASPPLASRGLAQMIFHFVHDAPPDERSQAQGCALLVEVGGDTHDTPPSTAFMACANARHSSCCVRSAVRPRVVSSYTRRLRPLSGAIAHELRRRPPRSSRCKAGYTVPSARSSLPWLRRLSCSMMAYRANRPPRPRPKDAAQH